MSEPDWSKSGAEVPELEADLNLPFRSGNVLERLWGNLLSAWPIRKPVTNATVAPWSGIGRVDYYKADPTDPSRDVHVANATAFLIKPDVMLTARHPLGEAWKPRKIRILVHVANGSSPVMVLPCRAYSWHDQYDLVALLIPAQSGACFLHSAAIPDLATLAGYPESSRKIRSATGAIQRDGNRLSYSIDTRPGDSGAHVFIERGHVCSAVGMHLRTDIGNDGVIRGKALPFPQNVMLAVDEVEELVRAKIRRG